MRSLQHATFVVTVRCRAVASLTEAEMHRHWAEGREVGAGKIQFPSRGSEYRDHGNIFLKISLFLYAKSCILVHS